MASRGVVHGASDKNATFPLEGKIEAADLIATIFHCLGYSPETEIRDCFDRPLRLAEGRRFRRYCEFEV